MTAAADAKTAGAANASGRSHDAQSGRETVESIVIAVILAFLFRSFVAEAFVIPTGSMAPTLQGRHIDVACPECGIRFRTGASDENDPEPLKRTLVTDTYCPNCAYHKVLDRQGVPNERSFNGDRILVSKYAFDLWDPARWDVIVFKYPGNAKQNYIKRLIGLPLELVMIYHGNIYVGQLALQTPDLSEKESLSAGRISDSLRKMFADASIPLSSEARMPPVSDVFIASSDWQAKILDGDVAYLVAEHEGRLQIYRSNLQIARKSSRKLLATLQLIHDSAYTADKLHEAGWPTRWNSWDRTSEWRTEDYGRSFEIKGSGWINYRHLPAGEDIWDAVEAGEKIDREPPPGELLTDYYTYNDKNNLRQLGNNWVGDLALECRVQLLDEAGLLTLELVRAGRRYRCQFDIAQGSATLSISDGAPFTSAGGASAVSPSASSNFKGKGSYRLRMTNVDNEVRVWVNNRQLTFDGPTTYEPTALDAPQWSPKDPGDTQPAGIGAEDAELKVTRIRLLRDTYYVARSWKGYGDSDFDLGSLDPTHPRFWNNESLFQSRRSVAFVLGEDQYFPLGDNSPQSQDGRLWPAVPTGPYRGPTPHFVSKKLLTGKALLIYWPHHWRWPTPFLPNFQRMGLIR